MRWGGWIVFVGLTGGLVAGCAGGKTAGQCDPAFDICECTAQSDCTDNAVCNADGLCEVVPDAGGIDSGPAIDAPVGIDAGPTVDAMPLKGFGEPCLDKAECASNICILAGIGGICTETCVAGSCPDDFGCIGVFGAIDPGEVADVCVPASTQICSTCSDSSECSLIGADLCLTYEDGKSFCSQDCSTVGCPGGYTCTDTDVGGTIFQQCIPNSGACDCNETLMGATEGCLIDTDFGTCAGVRTCQGAAGWGACEPPSPTDVPDGGFTDDNCDGIDGDIDGAIFVATSGTDTGTCGLTYMDPCLTISHGIIRALSASRGEVYIQAGDYNEVVVLQNGIDLYGSYDLNWQRDDHQVTGHIVRVTGGVDSGAGGDSQFLTVRARGLIVPTVIADLTIIGPDAIGNTGGAGNGSYAVYVRDSSDVQLHRFTVQGGNGAAGPGGSAGANAPSVVATAGMNGGAGGNADEFETVCNDSSRGGGGSRGTNSCAGSTDPDGGSGGAGGVMDTFCSINPFDPPNFDARPGDNGNSADFFVSSGSGFRGSGGGTCDPGGGGNSGRVINGSSGAGATGNGSLSNGYWFGNAGGAGGVGQNGSGGGGGGGGGGCDSGIDSYGAGGGGGGAGGCRAVSGGGGGGRGGGSFGLFVLNSSVTASECTLLRGNAGTGGTGGVGGRGQSGGGGGAGGLADGDSKVGGIGASGAHGGHGGGGGGGMGGISFGTYGSSATITHSCLVSGGAPGTGGAGGASAPTAPVAERDGNAGANGGAGTLGSNGVCASPAGC